MPDSSKPTPNLGRNVMISYSEGRLPASEAVRLLGLSGTGELRSALITAGLAIPGASAGEVRPNAAIFNQRLRDSTE
jgi:hypothetical protein